MSLIKSVSGVRGIVDPTRGHQVNLTPEVACNLGRAFATYLLRPEERDADQPWRMLGSRDGRPGGGRLLDEFARGAWECGIQTIALGIVTTPGTGLAVARTADSHSVRGGVIVTASHNPQQWNGIKLLLDGGRAPTAEQARAIFELFDRGDFDVVNRGNPPQEPQLPDVHDLHVTTVVRKVRQDAIQAHGFRVILDSINGAGARAGRMLLESLGCSVTPVNDEPDTAFAHQPEPTAHNLGGFCTTVADGRFDVGFAQDPDGDRLAIVDETGRYIGEEYTLALAVKYVFATRPGPAVANLSTSRMIDDLATTAGGACAVHRSAVGEANVVEAMRRVGAHIGGEGNGGVIDPSVVLIRDSLVAMALVLQLMADEGRPLSRIVDDMPRYTIVKEKLDADHRRIERILA
ncbi:MAG: phosphohexomutase domain-containing protein, partial [Planctomycetota bacterium]